MEFRNETVESYLRLLERSVRYYARLSGLDYNDAEDCLADMQKRRLSAGKVESLRADTDEERRQVSREAQWFVKRWIHDRNERARQAPSESLDQICADSDAEIASPDPGPEQVVIQNEELARVILIINKFSTWRRWLWWRVEIDGLPIAQIAADTGKTSGSLYKAIHSIRKRIVLEISKQKNGSENERPD